LRARDVDLADRLYAENTRLRTGEFAAAVAPLLTGLLRLHDQMASLANGDPASVAGMLRIQLLQILDTAAGLTPFEPRPGERFDASRHAGAGRTVTTDPTAEGTVARTLKPGFERADGSVVRVAQVEVHRFESR
jgi:molecular chaperone GrpE (heat shock protein)